MNTNLLAHRAERQSVWTRHWSTGAVHSCAGSFGDIYGGALAQAWRQWHAGTAPGSRILDVASGSGALPRLLLQLRPELDLNIDAVDLAQSTPTWLGQRAADSAATLHFHSGVAAESLPFADGSFDHVVHFHALPYSTEPERTLREAFRVLAPGAQMTLLTLARHQHVETARGYAHINDGQHPVELAHQLSSVGFVVERCGICPRERKAPSFELISAILGKPDLATTETSQ